MFFFFFVLRSNDFYSLVSNDRRYFSFFEFAVAHRSTIRAWYCGTNAISLLWSTQHRDTGTASAIWRPTAQIRDQLFFEFTYGIIIIRILQYNISRAFVVFKIFAMYLRLNWANRNASISIAILIDKRNLILFDKLLFTSKHYE